MPAWFISTPGTPSNQISGAELIVVEYVKCHFVDYKC